ncbi:Membrane magnesium transporter 1 [Tyrophagus putrescentiae]|nr:Membrane magnesium transporter 1 [Tyrophagus putrescentiae]
MLVKALTYLGIVSLLHAAFSAAQHKSYRRIVHEEEEEGAISGYDFFATSLPADIIAQAVISMLVVLSCLIARAGSFREIQTLDDLNRKPTDMFENQPSFYVFNHRGRILR